jgi:hypothetical protein
MSSNRITATGRAGEFTEPIYAGPAGQRKWPEFTSGRVTISTRALKLAKYAGTETRQLADREIALIFEKTSSRTRSAFEVAAYD